MTRTLHYCTVFSASRLSPVSTLSSRYRVRWIEYFLLALGLGIFDRLRFAGLWTSTDYFLWNDSRLNWTLSIHLSSSSCPVTVAVSGPYSSSI